MPSFYLLIPLSIISVHSRPSSNIDFTKRDCYESFSSPKQFIELSHYAPSGPPHLFIIIRFRIYNTSHADPIINIVEEYNFKRISGPCTGSFFFTTKGNNFTKMYINLEISLFKSHDMISDMYYEFGKNFIPGAYQLYDKNRNFGIIVEILKNGQQYVKNLIHFPNRAKSYVSSLKTNNGSICVITETSGIIVIKPIYDIFIPNGLITNIIFEFNHNNIVTDIYTYAAFECPNTEADFQDVVVIVDEKPQNEEIDYFSSTIKFELNKNTHIETIFSLYRISRVHVKQSLNLTQNYKKIFLIEDYRYIINCLDGTSRVLFISKYGTLFYQIEIKESEVAIDVNERHVIFHSPLKPC